MKVKVRGNGAGKKKTEDPARAGLRFAQQSGVGQSVVDSISGADLIKSNRLYP